MKASDRPVDVALFATCLADQLYPEAAVAAVRLLRRLGVRVSFPQRQTCCGQPAYNAGHHREARQLARHHLDVFADGAYVVLPSGSCGAMVTVHYPELFDGEPAARAEAGRLADRTFELTAFVVNVLGIEHVGADLRGTRVAFHDSCHALRSLGVRDAPRRLLRAAGAEVVELDPPDACCGFGGLFSVKLPEVSAAMADTKVASVLATGADVVTSTDAGCLMQIDGAMRRMGGGPEVVHVAELLWRGVERAERSAA